MASALQILVIRTVATSKTPKLHGSFLIDQEYSLVIAPSTVHLPSSIIISDQTYSPRMPPPKRKRRRTINSDWLDTLAQSRSARRLRVEDQHCRRTSLAFQQMNPSPTTRNRTTAANNEINPVPDSSECVDRVATRHPGEECMADIQNAVQEMPDALEQLRREHASVPVLDETVDQEEEQNTEILPPFQPFNNEDDYDNLLPTVEVNATQQLTNAPTIEPDRTRLRADIEYLRSSLSMWEGELNLLALVAVVGSVRFTVKQYGFVRDVLKEKSECDGMPPYSRVHDYFQEVIRKCLPGSAVVALPKKTIVPRKFDNNSDSEEEIPELEGDGEDENPPDIPDEEHSPSKENVRVFLPSSWAKLDVATSTMFEKMFPSHSHRSQNRSSAPLEYSRIIQEREKVTNPCDCVFVHDGVESILCSRGCELKVSVRHEPPNISTSHSMIETENGYTLIGTVSATWCVGSLQACNPSAVRALLIDSLTEKERRVIKALSNAPPRPTDNNESQSVILPGDMCTLLSTESLHDPFLIIIHRFWIYEGGLSSLELVFLEESQEQSSGCGNEYDILAKDVVSKVTLHNRNTPTSSPDRYALSSHGKLQSGMPYVIYRILLYCDDFQKSSQMSPKGSAGGCYFLPLSLPVEARRSTSAVRIISLTPPGVSTNEVLHYIVDDLVKGAVEGIRGFNPYGEELRIFMDVVGFVADYPAAAGSIDTIGHVGRASCTLCSFRRLHAREAEGSRFGYTTDAHSSNSKFLRHAERMSSLRTSNITDADLNRLGMVKNSKFSNHHCPLMHLQSTLEQRRSQIPLNEQGKPVVPGLFDPYRSNIIAPDHLLTGLSKNILNAVYKTLPTEQMRLETDIRICAALKDNGLLPQNEVFNKEKKKLHSMSLSELYCVLVVSVPVFRIITCTFPKLSIIRESVKLLGELQRLVAFTYWWPESELDGFQAESLVQGNKEKYFSDLKRISKNYVMSADHLCSKSSLVRRELDKPNLHRLIELYEHTIPAFGHAREFMELVFEGAHQPLKRCIAQSNNRNAHIFAVEHCVGNDWQGRISALYSDLSDPDETTTSVARRGLRRLLLGEESDLLHEEQDKEFIAETDQTLQLLFGSTLERQLRRDERVANFAVVRTSVWLPRGTATMEGLSKTLDVDPATMRRIVQHAKRWIDAVLPPVTSQEETKHEIQMYKYAKRVRLTTTNRKIGNTNGYDVVTPGCIVQAYISRNARTSRILIPSPREDAKLCFFAVAAVLQRRGDPTWVICLRCEAKGEKLMVTKKLEMDAFQILQLSPAVRRIAVYHVCREEEDPHTSCLVCTRSRTIKHSRTVLNGGELYFQRRINGYPPRMA